MKRTGSWREGRAIAVWLYGLACMLALGGALATLYVVIASGAPGAMEWLLAGGILLLAWTAAVVAWALAWMVGQRLRAAVPGGERPHTELAEMLSHHVEQTHILQRSLDELERLHLDILLPETQRPARHRQLRQQRSGELADRIRLSVDRADFGQAQMTLNQLGREDTDEVELRRLQRELDEARTTAADFELQQVAREIENLLAVSGFDRAWERAQEIHRQRPTSSKARELVDLVQRQQAAHRDQQAQTLYHDIETHASNRRWRDAWSCAQRLLQEHPDSPRAQEIQHSLPTLQANARIEEARIARDRLRELLRTRRFPEALDQAREIISRYPETVAARELREQMPRLEELTRTHWSTSP